MDDLQKLKCHIRCLQIKKDVLSKILAKEKQQKDELEQNFLCITKMYEFLHYNLIFKKFNKKHFNDDLWQNFKDNFLQLFENNNVKDVRNLKSSLQDHSIELEDGKNKIFEVYDKCQEYNEKLVEFEEKKDETVIINLTSNIDSSHKHIMLLLRTAIDKED